MYNSQHQPVASMGGHIHKVPTDHIKYLNTPPGAPDTLRGVAVPGDIYFDTIKGEYYYGQLDGSLADHNGAAPFFPLEQPVSYSLIPGHSQYIDPQELGFEATGGAFNWSGVAGSKIGTNGLFTLRETAEGLQIEKSTFGWQHQLRAKALGFPSGEGRQLGIVSMRRGNTNVMQGVSDVFKTLDSMGSYTGADGGEYLYGTTCNRYYNQGGGSTSQAHGNAVNAYGVSVKQIGVDGGVTGNTQTLVTVAVGSGDLFDSSAEIGAPVVYANTAPAKPEIICPHWVTYRSQAGSEFVIQGLKVT